MFSFDEIKNADIEIAEAMQDEMDRQQSLLQPKKWRVLESEHNQRPL